MERKSIKEMSQFILSPNEKIALMEAKIARAEQHIKALAELAKLEELKSARGSKYPTRR
jgi:hypothetical protein